MPRYKKYIILGSFLFLINGCANSLSQQKVKNVIKNYKTVKHDDFARENYYIMYALEYEKQGYIKNAKELYLKLFENTKKYEYLVKYLSFSFISKEYSDVEKIVKEHISKIEDIKEEESILRVYALSLFSQKKIKDTLPIVERLIEINKTSINYELLGNIYLESKEYKKSYDSFKKAYDIDSLPLSLIAMTNVKYFYLNERSNAEKMLENYIKKNGYTYNVAFQLLRFYEKNGKTKEVTDLLGKMYKKYKEDNNIKLLRQTQYLIISRLIKSDIYEAIDFIEKEDPTNLFLITLYEKTNQPKKLNNFLQKAYDETKDGIYLAQLAVLEYESTDEKSNVLNNVIKKFEEALKNLDNHIYQNYYAYILIDHDIDVKKGLIFVKKALEKEPQNIAYIDTLAWGQYKTNNCAEAYKNMKKIINKIKKEENEIKQHWEEIKRECNK